MYLLISTVFSCDGCGPWAFCFKFSSESVDELYTKNTLAPGVWMNFQMTPTGFKISFIQTLQILFGVQKTCSLFSSKHPLWWVTTGEGVWVGF